MIISFDMTLTKRGSDSFVIIIYLILSVPLTYLPTHLPASRRYTYPPTPFAPFTHLPHSPKRIPIIYQDVVSCRHTCHYAKLPTHHPTMFHPTPREKQAGPRRGDPASILLCIFAFVPDTGVQEHHSGFENTLWSTARIARCEPATEGA